MRIQNTCTWSKTDFVSANILFITLIGFLVDFQKKRSIREVLGNEVNCLYICKIFIRTYIKEYMALSIHYKCNRNLIEN